MFSSVNDCCARSKHDWISFNNRFTDFFCIDPYDIELFKNHVFQIIQTNGVCGRNRYYYPIIFVSFNKIFD